jgi:hypothetical protein
MIYIITREREFTYDEEENYINFALCKCGVIYWLDRLGFGQGDNRLAVISRMIKERKSLIPSIL